MLRLPVTACLTLMLSTAVHAQMLENDILKVELNGHDISITSKVLAPVSVPRLNLAKKVESVRAEPGRLVLTQDEGWTTTLALKQGFPFLRVFTEIANKTIEPAVYNQVDLLTLEADCGTALSKARALGTGGLTPVSGAKGSYAFSVIADPGTRGSVVCAYLTHERGIGIFFPEATDEKAMINAKIDFGSLRVDPGETWGAETLLIGCFEDGRLGLEAYADAVAEHYKIRLRPRPNVYCTWYHAGASDEKRLAANTAFAAENLKPFGLNVMQIDDKWQTLVPEGFKVSGKIKTTGPLKCFADANGKYPSGMAHTAENIASHGMIPGIWFMPWAGNLNNPYFDKEIYAQNPDGTPFHDGRWSGTCLDATSPKGEAFIRQRIKRIYDWGYRYFKIDGMHTGLATYNIYVNTSYKDKDYEAFGKVRLYDPHMTQVQAYRKCLRILQEEAPDARVLGCNVSQNMRSMGPAFGMIDAMRIGPDNGGAARGDWRSVPRGAWHGTNLYFLNGRVWYNDPDPVYVRSSNPIEAARWMCSWLAISGGMHTSSEQYDTLKPERLDMLKRCLPGHDCTARPVDYLETDKPRIWLSGNDRMHTIGLFSWEKGEETIEYDMGKLGLDKAKTYVGYDFWTDRFVAPFSGTLSQTLPGRTCRIIAAKPVADHPVLVSTSRHITQGLVDVLEERSDAGSRTLHGKSKVVAGDRYELRIALPAGANFRPSSATCGGKEMAIGAIGEGGVRMSITPEESETVEWSVKF